MRVRPLNYVWFCTDQQRFDTIGAFGNKAIRTPNIDRLVREGTSFTRAYAQSPICTPSRGAFLTGRYPRSARSSINGNVVFSRDEKLVTSYLADAGYRCGLTGKLHLTSAHKRMEARGDDGYSYMKWSHHPFDSWEPGINAYQDWLKEEGVDWHKAYDAPFDDWPCKIKPYRIPDHINGIEPKYHQTTWCVNEAIKFIDQTRDADPSQPWCISINVFDPHPPFDPPKEYKDKLNIADMPLPYYKEGELDNKPAEQQDCYERGSANGQVIPTKIITDDEKREITRDYYAEIMLIDDQLGRLIDYLDQNNLRENTVIIFLSDHGEMLGDHGIYWKGPFLYDCLVHVPLIFSCPGLIKQNLICDALVELVDIAPTMLELSELPVPKAMQGKSLKGILTGEADPHYHKDGVYAEYYYTAGRLWQVSATMYSDGHHKVIVHHNGPMSELYDLDKDPHEFRNLWDDPDSRSLREEMVLKCFNNAIESNIDRVLGNTGMF